MMRKGIMIMMALMGGVVVKAEVLKEEAFRYEIGTVIESTANWETPWGGASGMTVTNGLEFEGYSEGKRNEEKGIRNEEIAEGAVVLDGDCGAYQPHLAFKQVKEGCVYTAFLLYPYENYKTGWMMSYRGEGPKDTKNFTYVGRVSLDDMNQIGLRYYKNAEAVYNKEGLSPTQVYLCVLKYEIKKGDKNDEVSLYVFDKMPSGEPEKATVGPIKDASSPDIEPCQLVLRSYDADSWLTIGKIRVATTFCEAVGIEETGMEEGRREKEEGVRKWIEDGRLVIEANGRKYGAGGF